MAIVFRDDVPGKVCANPECGWKPVTEFGAARLSGIRVGDGLKSRCRDCLSAQRRAARAQDPQRYREKAAAYVRSRREHIAELKRLHRRAHPEMYDSALKRFREANRETLNQKAKERRAKHLGHAREIGRRSYERHQEKRRAYTRQWTSANRDKTAAANNRRRARKKSATGTHTLQEWLDLKAKYDFTCLCCQRREPDVVLTRDHVIPLTKGGSDSIDNIQPLCARCNTKKRTKTIDYRPQSDE